MPQTIEVPGLGKVEFPDGMSDDQIVSAIKANQPKPERSVAEGLGRQIGLTARAGIQGLASIPAMIANVPASLYNAGADLIQGNGQGYRFPEQGAAVSRALSQAGLPEPENATERVAQDMAGAVVGAGGTASLANLASRTVAGPVAQNSLKILASNPGMQVASAAGGSGAAGVGRENGAGPLAQLGLSVAGGAAPYGLHYGSASGLRGLIRGGEEGRKTVESNIKVFDDAGTAPSVGQATEARGSRAFESLLSKVPGGAAPMTRKAESQASQIGATAEKIASDLSAKSNPTIAGRIIEKGLAGEKGFIERFRGKSGELFDKLDRFIPKDRQIDVGNTKQTLADLNDDIPFAEALSEWFKNAKIQGIEKALAKDIKANAPSSFEANPASPSLMPYEAMKKLRTLVGRELESNSLAADVPRSKWKALYAALSKDMEAAAIQSGKPAEQAFSRANAFTRAGHDRIDGILDSVAGKDIPEKIFQAATGSSDMRNGATTVNAVLRSLQPAERNVVKSAFIKRMGIATPGNQGADGDTFSTQTFLTNWNKMSPEAKNIMFSGKDGGLRRSMDQLAKVAENIKDGSKVFANPSGTTQALTSRDAIVSSGVLLFTGHPILAMGPGAGAAASNLSARLMTNPKFVKWLAKSTQLPKSAIPANIQNLTREMANEPEEVQRDIQEYIKGIKTEGRKQ